MSNRADDFYKAHQVHLFVVTNERGREREREGVIGGDAVRMRESVSDLLPVDNGNVRRGS